MTALLIDVDWNLLRMNSRVEHMFPADDATRAVI